MTPTLTVVMPCLNEAETLATCIRRAQEGILAVGVAGEIVIADNGSSDGSAEIAEALGARVISVADRGYGNALAAGIAAASGTFVVMGDADNSYDFHDLGVFYSALMNGNDMVIGNRYSGGIAEGAMPRMHKWFGNRVLSAMGRVMFRVPVTDLYCGLRGFRRGAVISLDLRSTGMEFALEMIAKAQLHGLRITEVPARLSRDGRSRPPHLRTWRDGWRSVRFYLLYSPNWLFLWPGLAAMALGVAIMLWLAWEPRELLGAKLDVHTMLYGGVLVMIGLQAALFSIFGKIFAWTEGLLPENPRVMKVFAAIRLEYGLILGTALVVAGLAIGIWAVIVWQRGGFGPLDYQSTMRKIIPSGVLMVGGSQLILGSFFMSMLALQRRGRPHLSSDTD